MHFDSVCIKIIHIARSLIDDTELLMNIDALLKSVQKPSWYAGNELNSVAKELNGDMIRYVFCFPDLYNIGMSHLGIKILYHLLNEREDIWCERSFMPNSDMEELLRGNNIPLFALESKSSLADFDFLGFTLQYELCYTNILSILSLAGIPLRSSERGEDEPIIMGGGPCCCNPEPVADFFDIFVIGEAEEVLPQLMDLYKACGRRKSEFLDKARSFEGVYVPALDNGRKINRVIIKDLDSCYYPDKFVVPFSEIVHDRIMLEIMRGCIRGCRFCQAGMIYRPFRQKSPEALTENAKKICRNTGYDEISLTSLSTSDYPKINELADDLLEYCIPKNISLSLPSLRVDNFTKSLYDKVSSVRKSGLTFACEAGNQRLRDVINKNVTDEDIMNTCRIAFEGGATLVKLYFMIGLPTETDEDIAGIWQTAQNIFSYFQQYSPTSKKGVNITISLATFVPKPFTPFQWEKQISLEEIDRKQKYLRSLIKSKRVTLNYHDGTTSCLEGVFARGDRRLSDVIETAWKKGCKLDAWSEHFRFNLWCEALAEHGLGFETYAQREYDVDEPLPWDFVNIGVTKAFLKSEREKAYKGITTKNCLEGCSGCGVNKLCEGDLCP